MVMQKMDAFHGHAMRNEMEILKVWVKSPDQHEIIPEKLIVCAMACVEMCQASYDFAQDLHKMHLDKLVPMTTTYTETIYSVCRSNKSNYSLVNYAIANWKMTSYWMKFGTSSRYHQTSSPFHFTNGNKSPEGLLHGSSLIIRICVCMYHYIYFSTASQIYIYIITYAHGEPYSYASSYFSKTISRGISQRFQIDHLTRWMVIFMNHICSVSKPIVKSWLNHA